MVDSKGKYAQKVPPMDSTGLWSVKLKGFFRILFFFAPFPVFIDVTDLSFFIYLPPAGDLDAMQNTKPSIPLPIVALTVAGLIFASTSSILGRVLGIKMVCKKCWRFAILLIIVSIIPFMMLGVSILTFVQMYLGLLLVSSVSLIANREYLDKCTKSYLCGVFLWLFLHTLSVLYYNDFSPIGIDRNWNFSTFFGIYIYQSLVSYAAVVAVFFIISIFMYLETKARAIALGALILSGFVGFISETRLFVVDYLLIMALLIVFHRSSKHTFSNGVRKSIAVTWGGMVLLFGMIYYANRFVSKGSSDRFELIFMGLNEIMENPSLILWGAGLKHSYAHNFFIDFILNYGLLNLLFMMLVFLYSLTKIVSRLDLSRNGLVYSSMLGAVTITNSTFNSAITQPLFIGNVILALTIILSYTSAHHDRHPTDPHEKRNVGTKPSSSIRVSSL